MNLSHRNSAVDASIYDESYSPSARSSNPQNLHLHFMDKMNLSDNGAKGGISKRKKTKMKEPSSSS
jgi:hypothetical protein